jgi:cell wall-associated NlpC family hydrolase
MKNYLFSICFFSVALSACNLFEVKKTGDSTLATTTVTTTNAVQKDSLVVIDSLHARDSFVADNLRNKDTVLTPPKGAINTGNVHPNELMAFAESLKGVPYKYASTDPKVGFDCSGFITYVFNHFNIAVPRSSIDFTNVGKTIPVEQAKRGDIILFTGTDSTERFVGHMGLITANDKGVLQFIHSTSGKAYGVTVTPFNDYYKGRFVRTLRIFPQNDG